MLRWRTAAGSAASAQRLWDELTAGSGAPARQALGRFVHHMATRSVLTLQGRTLRRRAWRRARHNWSRRTLRRRLGVGRARRRSHARLRRTTFALASGAGEKQPFFPGNSRRREQPAPSARRRSKSPSGYRGRRDL